MNTHKPLKFLYLLILVIYLHHIYPMDLTLATENIIFPIQTYPANLQLIVFENMLAHLNTYQTTFFEDEQAQDKEEIKKIGVLRYQVTCLMIEHLLNNSIKPKKIPNSITAIKDILYRGMLFTSYSKMIKIDSSQLFKEMLKYKPITDIINEMPDNFSDILKTNKKIIFEKIQNKNFNFPKRPYLEETLRNDDLEENILVIPGKIPDYVITSLTTLGMIIISIPLALLLKFFFNYS